MSAQKNGPIVADLVAVATEKYFVDRRKVAVYLEISTSLALLGVCFSSHVAVTVYVFEIETFWFGAIVAVWPAGALVVAVRTAVVAVDVLAAAAAAVHAAVVLVAICGIHAAAVVYFRRLLLSMHMLRLLEKRIRLQKLLRLPGVRSKQVILLLQMR